MQILTVAFASLVATTALADTQVVVRGKIDHERLRERLASELATDVTLTSNACKSPCLSIRIVESAATVIYSPRTGGLRERTVELGDDEAQWPVVIALLASNLVRNEADDVLASLPAPRETLPRLPAPDSIELTTPVAQIESPERVEREQPLMVLGFGFVPGLSTDFLQVGRVRHLLSLDLIAGVSAGSSLITVSGLVDVERGNVDGFQLGGIVSTARETHGMQVAGVAGVTGDLHGLQLAGVAAVADRVDGLQLGGLVASADSSGVQIGGVTAYARGTAGFQLGGVASVAQNATVQVGGVTSVARGPTNTQIAGIATVAGQARLQIAGLVNIVDHLRGLQIGPINVAQQGDGVQVGVINIGGSEKSFSFGLINIVPGGRYDIEATIDTSRVGTALFRHGGTGWHNVYGIGGELVKDDASADQVWMYGLGFGPSWHAYSTRIDLELLGWWVNHGTRHSTDVSVLGQLRFSVSYDLGPTALVAGAAFNMYFSNDQMSPFFTARRMPGEMISTTSDDVTMEQWLTGFIGFRL